MDIFVQQLLNGLVLGSLYALIALGYTMVYGIMRLINFAHGEVVMIGAMVSISVIRALSGTGMSGIALLSVGLFAAMSVCMLLGFLVERVAYRPLRGAPRLAPLITAIGLSIVLQQIAVLIWGSGNISFPSILQSTQVHILGGSISSVQFGIVLLSLLVMGALLIMVEKTKLGRAMRATSQNPEVANLMGVNSNVVMSITFVIGSALGAIAGVMVAVNYDQANYYMGFTIGLKAFTAAVLGGIGNLGGAVAGGLLLGVVESLGAGYLDKFTGGVFGSNYQDIFAFAVLILVLIFRPSGLLGEKLADRA